MVNVSVSAEDVAVAAFVAHWERIWMIGNVVVESIGVPMTMIGSACTIGVLCRIKEGIAVSAKIYYFTLAVADFFAVFGYHFLLSFIDEDFRYLSNNTVYVAIEVHNVLCQFIYISLRQSEHTANWLYLVLCVEKLVAVAKPLVARNKFTKRWSLKVVAVCVLTGIPVDVICAVAYGPQHQALYGTTYCLLLDIYPFAFTYFVRLFISFTIYFLPICATVTASGFLLRSILSQAKQRRHLTADNVISKAGLSGSVTVLIMAGSHCVVFFPLGILSIWNVLLLSEPATDPFMLYSVNYLFWLVWNVSVLAHCTNAFIYFSRIPQFRNTLLCRTKSQ